MTRNALCCSIVRTKRHVANKRPYSHCQHYKSVVCHEQEPVAVSGYLAIDCVSYMMKKL